MKTNTYLFLLLLMLPVAGASQTLILEESFETDGNGIRYTSSNEFFDAKDDYFGRIYSPTEEYGSMGSGNMIDVIGDGTAGSQNGDFTPAKMVISISAAKIRTMMEEMVLMRKASPSCWILAMRAD